MAGQQLFYPPNVAGWDASRWLDTATWRGRWWIAGNVLRPYSLDPGTASQPYDAAALLDGALAFWRRPVLTAATHAALLAFAKSALAAAEAGRGLPAIEPGMPLPAGTGLSRRSFLAQGLGSMLAVYGTSKLGLAAFEEGIAAAAVGPAQPVLVSVFLEGGADSLSVLSPQGDPLYWKLRPKLALSGGAVFAEDERLHWHPAAGGIAQLYGERKVTVLPAIGYTNADQSHFTSRHYWEVGATSTGLTTGWLGRYLDRVGTMNNPLQGLSLDNTLAPALATTRVPIASIDGPDQYDFWSNRVWGDVETRMLTAIGALGATGGDP